MATRQQSHPHPTSRKSQPIVESADLLGLSEFSKDHQVVKQSGRGDTSSSSSPARIFGIYPSHPSISTVLKIETPKTEEHASFASSPAQSISQPIKNQETAQDRARRINQEINNNEKKLSEMKAIGYVPPHLRPPPRAAVDDTEDGYGNYIPPHLRRPRGIDGRARVSNLANMGWGSSGQDSLANRPHKVSVVLTPISQIVEKQTADITSTIEVVKPATMSMPPSHRALTSILVKRSMGTQQSTVTAPMLLSAHDLPRSENTATNRLNPPRRKAASPPSSPSSPPPVSGTKIKTAYFPLRPETPPPPSTHRSEDDSSHDRQYDSSNDRNDNHSSYGRQDGRSSVGRSSIGRGNGEGDFLMLDHERTRKMRSYTRYRAKPGFAPHNPRLPFEFLHKIYGQAGATYAETLGERLDSSSVIGPRSLPVPSKTYGRPFTPQGHVIPNNLASGYRIPKHEHIRGYNSTVALGGGSETSTMETGDLIFKTWPQPPDRTANKKHQQSRSVILSGFKKMVSWKQISRVCKDTGKVEDMEISNKRGMAMVTFVKASTAQHFYGTTDARGIPLVYVDEETNETVRARIYIDMNPEIIAIEDSICQIVDTEGASRVLEVIGWTRDILESMVGGSHEGGIGYSDLLMRLASLYCRPQRIQCVDWRQNEAGHMEVRFVYAGIKDAVRARVGLGKEPALESCQVVYGSDP